MKIAKVKITNFKCYDETFSVQFNVSGMSAPRLRRLDFHGAWWAAPAV